MKYRDYILKLQTVFGVTKSEIFIAGLMVLGLLLGAANKYLLPGNEQKQNNAGEIYYILDSLAEAQRTTFVGSDSSGNPDPELAIGDTVIKKDSFFPQPQKKILPTGKININSASKPELMQLPGIGEKTAQKIIDYRNKQPFGKEEDLMRIKGIGIKKMEKLRPLIKVN